MTSPPPTPWDAALTIIQQLRSVGFAALLAGGCVRDRLLGRIPNDYDVATNARPERVQELFPKARLVGAKFGVVLVRRLGHDIEVATFRSDGAYSDGRHPDQVIFGDERADALRRDFTINGLFYDPVADRVIDYVDGQPDLKACVIRTIGDPDARFGEDHLRMLRAVRLSARLGFSIDPKTAAAITRLASQLRLISPERIWMELEQILTEPTRCEGWRLLLSLGLRPHLCPEWPPDSTADALAQRRLGALRQEAIKPGLALAAALPDAAPRQLEEICRALRLSNDLTEEVVWIKTNLEAARRAESLELADFKALRANPAWPLLLEFLHGDCIARNRNTMPYEKAKARGDAIRQEDAAPPPLVTGDDLLALGFKASPVLGAILRSVYRAQLNELIATHEEGIALARQIAQQQES